VRRAARATATATRATATATREGGTDATATDATATDATATDAMATDATATDATTTDATTTTDAVAHYGVQCDACEAMPVRGSRYKSVAHDDYDLCERCFAAGRGAACGPYAKLDLPLPAGLPPVVQNDDGADAEDGMTREERSEAGVDALGEMLRAAAEIARGFAPVVDGVATRFARASRENTVETQAANLRAASVMHAVGALWCELARCMAVVPPPPGVMTPEGAAMAGDDINNAQSFFSFPRASYIADSGEFAHTRPPGMPLHTQDDAFAQGHPQGHAARPAGVLRVMHQVHSLEGVQGAEGLPPELRELLMRQVAQATPAPDANPTADAATTEAQRPPPPMQTDHAHARRQAQAQSSQRALSRFLGSVFRVIPSPSFMTTQTHASATTPRAHAQTPTDAARRDAPTVARDVAAAAADAATRRPSPLSSQSVDAAPTRATNAADDARGSERAHAPVNRARARGDSNEDDAGARAAKASNTGNGLSPAASAAHLARDQGAPSNLGASTSRATAEKEEDEEE